MRTFHLPTFILYADTNSVFSKSIDAVISRKFCDKIAKLKGMTSIQVCLPDVVCSELQYQQYRQAVESRSNAVKNLTNLGKATGQSVIVLPDDSSIKQAVVEKFLAEIKAIEAEILDTPYKQIEWSQIVEASCWRFPPFSQCESDGEQKEKGFRDAIILETIVEHRARQHDETGVTHYAVVTNDTLLTEAIKSRMDKASLHIFKTIDEFESHLNLLSENATEDFTKAVLAKVDSVFFDEENPDCLFNQFDIKGKLVRQHSSLFDHPGYFFTNNAKGFVPRPQIRQGLLSKPISEIRIIRGVSSFVPNNSDPTRFCWSSEITVARLFRKMGSPISISELSLLTVPFAVNWSSEIDRGTAEFSKLELNGISPVPKKQFRPPTSLDLATYGFPIEAMWDRNWTEISESSTS